MCCHSFSVATKPGVLGCPPITGDRAMPPFPSHISWLHDCPSSRAEFRASEKSVIECSVNLRVCIGRAGWLVRNSIMECSFGGTLPHCILVAVNTIRQGGREGVVLQSLKVPLPCREPGHTYLCRPLRAPCFVCQKVRDGGRECHSMANQGPQFARAKMLYLTRQHVARWRKYGQQDTRERFRPRPVTVFGATSVSQDHRVRKYFFQREKHFPGVKSRELHEGELSCAEKFGQNAHSMTNGTVASHCTEYVCAYDIVCAANEERA